MHWLPSIINHELNESCTWRWISSKTFHLYVCANCKFLALPLTLQGFNVYEEKVAFCLKMNYLSWWNHMNCIDLKLYLKNEVRLKILFKMKIISGKISKKSNRKIIWPLWVEALELKEFLEIILFPFPFCFSQKIVKNV